ncbi:MAG TPA: PilX N-terminal domain-containing pilus assembly protein [Gammaproteobacteria bacterium]|nr:PilX N-terminal domain-containing pilus assembly protein [Gammaproteobacteria bacterium]
MNMQFQQGMVLVMALLYLSVITLLVCSAFEVGLVQIKIASHLTDDAQALQNAQSALVAGEIAIQGNETEGQGDAGQQSLYQFKRRPESACGVIYYQINATGTYATAKSELESILLIPVAGEVECPDKISQRQEVAWRQVL